MHYLCLTTCTVVFSLLFSLIDSAHAHDPGLSAANVRMADSQISAHLTFARRDIESLIPIDTDRDGSVTAAEFDAALPLLKMLTSSMMEISIDNQRVAAQVASVELDQSDALHFQLNFPQKVGSQLSVSMPIIAKLARGHRQYVSVRDKKENLVAECILNANNPVFELCSTNLTNGSKLYPQCK